MNATGLPIPAVSAPTTPPSVDPASAATGSGAQAPTDFVIALAQMIGTSVPTTSGEPAVPRAEVDLDEAAAAALGLMPLPFVQTQLPANAQPPQGFDPLEMLGLTAVPPEAASARDAAILQALTERLAVADEAPQEVQLPNGAVLPQVEATQPRVGVQDTAAARGLHSPVGTQAWADELGTRLTMMTDKGQHTASLRLSPEHLGPLEVRISMREDQASVWFGAAHADTRAAIEHALPRLRELFAAQGMSLADTGVFREPPRQQMPGFQGSAGSAGEEAASVEASVSSVRIGLVDAYA